MNYAAFTNDSLLMIYEGVRGALAVDDGLNASGEKARFAARETPRSSGEAFAVVLASDFVPWGPLIA